jgi:hypothetical protein
MEAQNRRARKTGLGINSNRKNGRKVLATNPEVKRKSKKIFTNMDDASGIKESFSR